MEYSHDAVAQVLVDEAAACMVAGGRPVDLLERFEDELLLVVGNADAGIFHPDADLLVVVWPRSVHLMALPTRLKRICCRRFSSPWTGWKVCAPVQTQKEGLLPESRKALSVIKFDIVEFGYSRLFFSNTGQ